ncbi:RNA-binding protein 44 isoform X2 [Mixophyes fleayi]|uniref:RNA-binding protein 44 isoform X2 n=1 Tax=Mixophyes fleayi TaxID=3061075 RepID=UPI003F4D76F4
MAYTDFYNGFYKSCPVTPQSTTFQYNAGDMLPFCQNNMSVPFGHTTVGYSVTFPACPYQNAAITEFPQQQNFLHTSAGISSEDTCQKCKLEKRDSLNRQVCELLKKHSPVEVAGKEILGWYMLLAAEDRKIIKEYGSITEFLKDNPSLLIVNNWVTLKSKSSLKISSGNYCFFMESPESTGHSYSPNYTKVYSGALHRPAHVDDLVTEVNPDTETIWFDQVNHFKKEELPGGNKMSMYEYAKQASPSLEGWDTSIEAHTMNCDRDHFEDYPPSAVLPLVATFNEETAVSCRDVMSCSHHLITENLAVKQVVDDSPVMSKEPSYSYLSRYAQMNITQQKCQETEPAICESFDDSGITEGDVVINSTDNYSSLKESERLLEQDESHSTLKWQKYNSDSTGDQEYSASDILDDETFLSVKSGSLYSRSSSLFSLDDNTDVEQCVFEEALEDLSSFSLYSPLNHSHGLLCTPTDASPQSFVDKQCSMVNNELKAISAKINFPDITAAEGKSKLRDRSCNTDLSWVSDCCKDKGTQTIQMETQDAAVNTDIMIRGLFSLTQDTIQTGTGACKDMEHSEGVRDSLSSTTSEALLQRAVKAELQLVDVQRWLCWQTCWKTQQQNMEKQSYINLHGAPSDQSPTGVSFNLLSALAEVEEKYQEMKKQIQSGVPLDTLIPLSMQLTKVDTSSDNLLKECFTNTCQHSTMQKESDGPPGNSVKNDLTSMSISVAQNDQQREGKEVSHSKDLSDGQQHYYVHVGNIAPFVKEVQLMNAFKKYNVYNVFLEESSLSSSYAVLIFTCSEQAQAAVKEMDGKEFLGKKLKVRAIKNSNYNLSLAIKTFSETLPQGQVKFGTTEPKECFASTPPKSVSTPKPVSHGDTPKVQGGESLKNDFMNVPKNNCFFPYNKPNQVFSSAPYSNMSSFSNLVPPGYQWMLQSLHSNMMAYSGIPNPMRFPYSYPLYPLPSCPQFPLQVPVKNSNIYMPGFDMKSNSTTYTGKYGSSYIPAKPVKPVYTTDCQSIFSNVGDLEQNNAMSSTTKTLISERDTNARNTVDKSSAAQSVNGPASVFTTSNTEKLAESVSVPMTTLCQVATTVTDSLSPCDNLTKLTSVPSSFKSTTPLRVPTFVPRTVTIPKASNVPANIMSSTGVLSYSANKAHVSFDDASEKGDSVPSAEMDWDVYPQIDTSSELPAIIIPNQLNFCQFKKVMTHLTELHKDVARDQIIGALEEIRRNRGGSLGGLTIPKIISEASFKLTTRQTPPV